MTAAKSLQKTGGGKGKKGGEQLVIANSFWLRWTRGNTIERICLYQNKILSRCWQGNFSALLTPWQETRMRPVHHLKIIWLFKSTRIFKYSDLKVVFNRIDKTINFNWLWPRFGGCFEKHESLWSHSIVVHFYNYPSIESANVIKSYSSNPISNPNFMVFTFGGNMWTFCFHL